MLRRSIAILGLLLFAEMSIANDIPASDASIREFLEITNARNLIGTMRGQMDNLMRTQMQSALQGKPMTPEVKAIIDRMQQRMIEAMNETLKWETLEPIYFRMFGNSFSQDEMDSIIALYKTPAGQLLIKKMPLVLKNAKQRNEKAELARSDGSATAIDHFIFKV